MLLALTIYNLHIIIALIWNYSYAWTISKNHPCFSSSNKKFFLLYLTFFNWERKIAVGERGAFGSLSFQEFKESSNQFNKEGVISSSYFNIDLKSIKVQYIQKASKGCSYYQMKVNRNRLNCLDGGLVFDRIVYHPSFVTLCHLGFCSHKSNLLDQITKWYHHHLLLNSFKMGYRKKPLQISNIITFISSLY